MTDELKLVKPEEKKEAPWTWKYLQNNPKIEKEKKEQLERYHLNRKK